MVVNSWEKDLAIKQSVAGELVFNTGMMGYPETMTDAFLCGANHSFDLSSHWQLWNS